MSAKINFPLSPEILDNRRILGDEDDLHGKVDDIKAVTDNLPADTDAVLTSIEGKVDGIKALTDNLPVDTASTLTTIDGNIDDIKAVTDLLPDAGALTSLAQALALSTTDGKVDAIKAKTDNLPANTSTVLTGISTKTNNLPSDTAAEFTAIKGSGFSTENLKNIYAGILAIQNNTSFTASVVPQMIIPVTGNADFTNLVNVYDGVGNLEDPDLNTVLLKAANAHAVSRNSNLFVDASRSTACTKVVVYTITAPVVAPTAGAVYKDSADTEFTVIGMIGTTVLISSWTGVTAPVLGTGTLTRVSGTGDSGLTADVVDSSYASLLRENTGQFSSFYNVVSTAAEENLTFRFGYYEAGVWKAYDRSTNILSPQSAATTAGLVWEEPTASHTGSGTFGKMEADIKTAVATIQAVTDELPDAGALTSLAQALALSTTDGKVDLIKAKTDNLPANTATTLSNIKDAVDVIDGLLDVATTDATANAVERDVIGNKTDAGVVVVGTTKSLQAYAKGNLTTALAIKTLTDNLPSNTSTVLGTPVAMDGGTASLAGMLRKLFDDGSGFDATLHSLKAIRDAISSEYPATFAGAKATDLVSSGNSETLEFSTSEGVLTNNVTLAELKITVTGTTTNFTIQIFEKTGAPVLNKRYEIQGADSNGVNILFPVLIFRNADTVKTNTIYVKILNVADAGSSSFTTELRGTLNAN